MADKIVATECCLCYREMVLCLFFWDRTDLMTFPYSYSLTSYGPESFLAKIHYFILILLFDPCNYLLPCLSALVLTKWTAIYLFILIALGCN